MADTGFQGSEITKLFDSWLNTANKFWKDIEKSGGESLKWGEVNFNFGGLDDEQATDDKHRTYKAWQTSVDNFTSFLKIMSTPENQEAMVKSSTAFTEAMSHAAEESFENLLEFQANLIQSLAKASEYTTSYNFEDIDQSAFESFRTFYKTELQKYLHIPKIGLPRELHEQLSDLVDKSNIFHSYLGELFYLFSLPFEKTNYVTQQRIKSMLDKGEIENDPAQFYKEWIKVLEGQFMQLLKSEEYTELLNNIIGSLAAYKEVKNDVTSIFLKELQIPTNKDMDDVYKDLYLMKKKGVRAHQKSGGAGKGPKSVISWCPVLLTR